MQALAEGRLAPIREPVSCYGHRLLSLYRAFNIVIRRYSFMNAPFLLFKNTSGSGAAPRGSRAQHGIKKGAPVGTPLVSLIGLVIIPLVFFACGPNRAESERTHSGSC